jgi:ribA/ribD-fused uncharacterized protein
MRWQAEDRTVFADCAVIFRVRDEFGGLSNMASGFPLSVNGLTVPSSEALYQACRFPHQPEWQLEVLAEPSPMAAKMLARKDRRREDHSRFDWDRVVRDVMRWVLRVKTAQHFGRVAQLLRATEGRAIVERSRRDPFWGAIEGPDGTLRGRNELGRLWMELRDEVGAAGPDGFETVEPLAIPGFLLLGQQIEAVAGAREPQPA